MKIVKSYFFSDRRKNGKSVSILVQVNSEALPMERKKKSASTSTASATRPDDGPSSYSGRLTCSAGD